MLYLAFTFLVIALIAAVFAFGGIVVGAAPIAKWVFFLCLVLFVLSLLGAAIRRRCPVDGQHAG